jgi:hypothetical protein
MSLSVRRKRRGWMVAGTICVAGLAGIWLLLQPTRCAFRRSWSDARAIHSAAALYMVEAQRCATAEELVSSGAVLPRSVRDGWGTPMQIRCAEGEVFEVVSAGSDRRWNTRDDLSTRMPVGAWPYE